jgi:hypothetical protein
MIVDRTDLNYDYMDCRLHRMTRQSMTCAIIIQISEICDLS